MDGENLQRLLVIILSLWAVCISSTAIDSNSIWPIVETGLGRIKGTIEQTLLNNREYYAFRGIPYGKPPIGALRFKAPVAADAWPDILDGSKFGNACAQPNMYMTSFIGSEDCLTLNVFTPGIIP